jgi:hypothetical protein
VQPVCHVEHLLLPGLLHTRLRYIDDPATGHGFLAVNMGEQCSTIGARLMRRCLLAPALHSSLLDELPELKLLHSLWVGVRVGLDTGSIEVTVYPVSIIRAVIGMSACISMSAYPSISAYPAYQQHISMSACQHSGISA